MAFSSDKTYSVVSRMVAMLLFIASSMSSSFAQGQLNNWHTESRLYLTGMTSYIENRTGSVSYESFIASGELRWILPARRWYTSLFAEYRVSADDRFDDISNLGAYWKYNLDRWDVTSYLFVNVTPQSSQTWYYAGRLRYRLAENHKFGVEAAGVFSALHSPALAVSYYASLGDMLTLKIVADPGMNGSPDFAARAELMWQVH